MLFNRFLAVRFKDAGLVIGGRQTLAGTYLQVPPTIEIECSHTNESSPNEATIKLFNVAPETQKRLFVAGKRVEIEAGYWPQDGARDTGIIFAGQIREVTTSTENDVDVVSELTFGDSDDAARVRRTRKVHPQGTSHATVVRGIAADMEKDGVVVGRIEVPNYVEPRALTIDRPSWRALDEICHQHDLMWSIQDGTLNVIPASKPLKDNPIRLSPVTGVLGVPKFTTEGVEFDCLMLHYLRPGYTFVLENAAVRSRAPEKYRIEEINFNGSNVGDQFGASIKARVMGTDGKVKRSRDRGRKRGA